LATAYSILAQVNPNADTLTDGYTVPSSTQAVISTIVVCNRSDATTRFRISVAIDGASNDDKQYLYYDVPIPGNDTFVATLGITLGDTDKIRVYADDATLSFNIFGTEIT
jgi:hypothetical protein